MMKLIRLALGLILLLSCLPAGLVAEEEWAAADLERELAAVEQEFPEPRGEAWRLNYPLARLQLKKAHLAEDQSWLDPDPFIRRGQEYLAMLRQGQPYRAQPGELTELAYIADNDDSVQPYYLYLPPDYTPEQRWPLLVFLHGYVPSITVLYPWVLGEREYALAGELGCILLIPYGRRNTDFQGVGEVDVLASLAETKELHSVDEDHVYLTGVSMGGRGTWHIAAHYPHLFAAIAPISGHTEMARWWGWSREQMPAFKQWMVDRDGPLALAENLRSLPIFVQHGGNDDLIATEQSRIMVERLRELDIPVEYHEVPGGGHYIYWDLQVYRRAWEFLVQHRRSSSPRHLTHKAYTPDYGQAYWLALEQFAEGGMPASVEASVNQEGDEIRVQTTNVAWLTLDLQNAPVTRNGSIRMMIDGQQRDPVEGNGLVSYNLSEGEVAAPRVTWAPPKSAGLCGPIQEAFNEPFLLVVGTAGSEEQDADLQAKAQRWAEEWEAFADGWPRLTTDQQLTREEIEEHNLVLFGRPQTNTVIAEIASHLPLRIGDHRYQVGDRIYQGPHLGLAMCYPNPFAANRYVVIFAGEFWGEHLSINHKFDLLPDYLIYDTSRQEYDGTDQHLCAGFFDNHWQLDESRQSRFENVGAEVRRGLRTAERLRQFM